MKQDFAQRVERMVSSVAGRVKASPKTAIVLGSGLSGLAEEVGGTVIPYSEIAEFPEPTVKGHKGEMTVTDNCLYMAGRFHYYEGHSMDNVVLPVCLLAGLGVKTLILTNASGGVNESYKPGDLVIIRDHINLMGTNPLMGPNDPELGPRFPDMTEIYTKRLRGAAKEAAGGDMAEGVYAGLTGPSYETPAEIKMLRTLGADMVGMSTVPEAITAKYLGLDVLGISCITNMAAGILDQPLNHEEVMEVGRQVGEKFKALVVNLINELS